MRDRDASSPFARYTAARSGKSSAITSAAAGDCVECPDGYDGKGGVENTVLSVGSLVTGRATQYVYFVSQHATHASYIAALRYARARAACGMLSRCDAISSSMNSSHRMDGASVAQ